MKPLRLSQSRFERTAAALASAFPSYRVLTQPFFVPELPIREHAIWVLDIPEGRGRDNEKRIYEFLDTTLGFDFANLITVWTESEEGSQKLFPRDHPERWRADVTLVSPNGVPHPKRRAAPRKPAARRAPVGRK
jgi:hypothetical protein